jgi:DNA-binding MarR family transcriptional regulator
MIVGDIQRLLGVLPAQTSRIVRSLESRNPPLIRCQINPQDKRKINVELTPAGEKQLERFASPRLKILTEMLSRLNDNEREQLAHLLDRLQATS